jgi:hypothetical protein
MGDSSTADASEARFQEVVATLDYPMYIVTTAVGEERAGCLIGLTSQCSIDAPTPGCPGRAGPHGGRAPPTSATSPSRR